MDPQTMPADRAPRVLETVDASPIDWVVSPHLVEYPAAVAFMERRVADIADGRAPEMVWLLEHPPIYTAGTSAKDEDLLHRERFPTYQTGRGGQFTYHGPGQRVVYVMLDVRKRTGDVRAFVGVLEKWLIDALAEIGVTGETRPDRVGVWTRRPELGPNREDKIAAIGIRLRRWISFHGMSINVAPDLEHFSGIVPCGVSEHGVTSLQDLSAAGATMMDLDTALETTFRRLIGPVGRKLVLEP